VTIPLSRLDNRSSLIEVRLGFSKLGGDGPVKSFRESKQFGKGKMIDELLQYSAVCGESDLSRLEGKRSFFFLALVTAARLRFLRRRCCENVVWLRGEVRGSSG